MNASDPIAARIQKWAQANGTAWLHGYCSYDVMDCYRQLASAVINTTINRQNAPECHLPHRANKCHPKTLRRCEEQKREVPWSQHLPELDAPGEYCTDEAALMLYFLPPSADTSSNPERPTAPAPELVLSVGGGTLIDIASVKYVSIKYVSVKYVNLVNLTVAFGRSAGSRRRRWSMWSFQIAPCLRLAGTVFCSTDRTPGLQGLAFTTQNAVVSTSNPHYHCIYRGAHLPVLVIPSQVPDQGIVRSQDATERSWFKVSRFWKVTV